MCILYSCNLSIHVNSPRSSCPKSKIHAISSHPLNTYRSSTFTLPPSNLPSPTSDSPSAIETCPTSLQYSTIPDCCSRTTCCLCGESNWQPSPELSSSRDSSLFHFASISWKRK